MNNLRAGGVPATIYSGVFEGMEYSSLEEYRVYVDLKGYRP